MIEKLITGLILAFVAVIVGIYFYRMWTGKTRGCGGSCGSCGSKAAGKDGVTCGDKEEQG